LTARSAPQTLVVVPTYNERGNLPVLTEQLMLHPMVRLLVVDDQSPDGTGQLADQLATQYAGRINVIHRTEKRGFGRSYIEGLTRAIHEPVDVVCQMDADLSHDPRQLPSLLERLDDADIVIGSRYVSGGTIVNWPLRRRVLSRAANVYIRSVTHLSARDCTSGYRCWRREALARLPLEHFMSDGYSFLIEMLYRASGLGLRIAESPITFVERREGESKVSKAVLIESAITPWRLIADSESRRKAPRKTNR